MEELLGPRVTYPSVRVTDPEFRYVPWWKTDVQATWRRFGWEPRFLTTEQWSKSLAMLFKECE